MALAFRAGWTNATQAQNLSIATSTLAHDILVAYAADDDVGRTFTWPSGFTQQATQTTSTHDGSDLGVATKSDATGSEGSQTITISSNSIIGGIAAYSGGDNTTPLDVAVVQGTATAGTTSDVTVTPVTNGAMIVLVIDGDPDGNVNTTFGVSIVSGSTGALNQRADLNSGFRNIALYDSLQATAGPVTLRISTTGGTNNDRSWAVLVLRPAAGGGGGGITATLDATEGVDTAGSTALAAIAASLSGAEAGDGAAAAAAAALVAALAATEAADSLTASAAVVLATSLARTESADTAAAAAAVAVAATLASAEAVDAAASAASVAVSAALSGSEAADTLAAAILGAGFSAAITEAADGFGATAAAAILAGAAIAEAGDVGAASATVGIAADATAAELADALSAQAAAVVLAAVAPIEAPDLLAASVVQGVAAPLVHAAITATRPNTQTAARPATTAAARPANLSRGIRR